MTDNNQFTNNLAKRNVYITAKPNGKDLINLFDKSGIFKLKSIDKKSDYLNIFPELL